jgi:hypothetical protein
MGRAKLAKDEVAKIKAHVRAHPRTIAVIRTEHAPGELSPLLAALARECKTKLTRTFSSPLSEFGIAEFNSDDRMLIVLHVVGDHTTLLSVSQTDEVMVRELEEKIHLSNFQSEIIRLGL